MIRDNSLDLHGFRQSTKVQKSFKTGDNYHVYWPTYKPLSLLKADYSMKDSKQLLRPSRFPPIFKGTKTFLNGASQPAAMFTKSFVNLPFSSRKKRRTLYSWAFSSFSYWRWQAHKEVIWSNAYRDNDYKIKDVNLKHPKHETSSLSKREGSSPSKRVASSLSNWIWNHHTS